MKTSRPSINHPNRAAHNWLVYDIIDDCLEKSEEYVKGAVFDLGSGSSPYKQYFLSLAHEYIAIDWGQSLHERNVDIVADLNKPLPLRNEVADVVISLSVIEHLKSPQTMLAEAFRILKPGGVILLQVPWQWWVHEAPHDYYRYTPYGLEALCTTAGFHILELEPQAGLFTTIILKLNYFTRRLARGPGLFKRGLRLVFPLFWYLGQKAAPYLDKLDSNWLLETSGYFVAAKKP